ncbi:MAG TPA: beta-propeller fold lactonase family protein [Steroidobacteraceae bacterium]|nr:beta-propeller fold lactonase family protein [Steroidobacteraceae bacterium]
MLRSIGSMTVLALLMVGCGGGGGGDSGPPPPPPPATYTVAGTVSGLQGSGLVIQIADPGTGGGPGHPGHGGHDVGLPLQITSNGPFTAIESPPTVGKWLVARISQQPSPYQFCLLRYPDNLQATNVTDIEVGCSQFAYVANAGDNTVSAYTVDASSGALAAVGTPVKTGMSPHAIAETPERTFVFVANEVSNDISAFAVNFVTGALMPVPGSPFPAGTAPRALETDGGVLYVANAGTDTVSAYGIDGTGALTPFSSGTFATGKGPSSILQLGPQILYVANNGGSDDISAFLIGPGALYPVSGSPFPAGGNPLSLAVADTFLYSANPDATNPSISGFSIDISTGVLSPLSGSPFPLPVSHNIATDNVHLYVTSGANVLGYGIDATTGALTPLPGFPVFAGANAYSITIENAQFLYVADDGAANVAAFRIDGTGSLTPIAGSPFAAGSHPESIATY